MTKKGRGWHGEPRRHADAARGVKSTKNKPMAKTVKWTPRTVSPEDFQALIKRLKRMGIDYRGLRFYKGKQEVGTWEHAYIGKKMKWHTVRLREDLWKPQKLQRARFPFLGIPGPVLADTLKRRAQEVAQELRDIGHTGVEARLKKKFGENEAWVVMSDDMGASDPGKMHPIVIGQLAKKAKGKPHMQIKRVKGGHEIRLWEA